VKPTGGLNENVLTGKRSVHNVLIDQLGLTQHAKQMIHSPLSAFRLLIDNKMLSHVQRCTDAKAAFPAHRVFQRDI